MPVISIRSEPRYADRRATPAQFLDLPPDGYRYELIQGVMQLTPSPREEHARPHRRILTDMELFLRAHPNLGEVFFEFSVFLPDGNVFEPDIVFVSAAQAGIVTGHIHGVPDLIVEVLSPSTRERDRGVKADAYLQCGVKEYWLVDPEHKTNLELWQNQKNGGCHKLNGARIESQILPGFVFDVRQIFPERE